MQLIKRTEYITRNALGTLKTHIHPQTENIFVKLGGTWHLPSIINLEAFSLLRFFFAIHHTKWKPQAYCHSWTQLSWLSPGGGNLWLLYPSLNSQKKWELRFLISICHPFSWEGLGEFLKISQIFIFRNAVLFFDGRGGGGRVEWEKVRQILSTSIKLFFFFLKLHHANSTYPKLPFPSHFDTHFLCLFFLT